MGLSAYGKEDKNIKSFVNPDYTLDTDQFYRSRFGLTFLPYEYVKYPKDVDQFIDLPEEDRQRFCNLAYRLQKDFELYMSNLILKVLEITGEKNIVLTGGCALNCVANYEYLKILPKGVKLYVEPISTDAGTSIGMAKLDYYSSTKSTSRHPLKTLYLGLE
jgi:predicted NodU family carbamoyl transferase